MNRIATIGAIVSSGNREDLMPAGSTGAPSPAANRPGVSRTGRENQSLSPSATITRRFRNGHAWPRHYRLCRVSERRARALLGGPQATAHQRVRRALGYLRAGSCPDGPESRQARTLLVLHTCPRARVRGGGLGDRSELGLPRGPFRIRDGCFASSMRHVHGQHSGGGPVGNIRRPRA